MLPNIKSVEHIKKTISDLPYAAKIERKPKAEACKKALNDLTALGKVSNQDIMRITQDLQIYLGH